MTEKPKSKPSRPFWKLTIPLWIAVLISLILVISTYMASQEDPIYITVFGTPELYGSSQTDFTYIQTLSSATPKTLETYPDMELTTVAESMDITPCRDLARTSSGQFAFRMFLQSGMELFRIDEDGDKLCRLTNNTGNDDYPSWSPDGEHIAYVSIDGTYGLYMMDADGSNIDLLHSTATAYSYPSWSPDGDFIIFQATIDEVFDIYRLELATGELVNLTNQERLDNMAVYSPNGQFIVFVSDRTFNPYVNTNPLSQPDNYEIYMMNSDGTNPRRLTVNIGAESFPSFSPDSQQIVFEYRGQIMIMNIDGSGLRELTQGRHPIWLPDGRIAYQYGNIMTILPDGTDNSAITDNIPIFGSGIQQISYTVPR